MPGVLLFGGSFNPIHHAHLIVSRAVAERLEASRVVLIPGASPPHKDRGQLAPAEARLELCRLAVQGDPLFDVSDWELRQPGPNYSLLTVRHFRQALPADAEIFWLIGSDSLAELHTWHRVPDLLKECTIVTVGRRGTTEPDLSRLATMITPAQLERLQAHVLETPLIEISATDIRARVQAGRSIRYLVPAAVADAIERRGLYRAS